MIRLRRVVTESYGFVTFSSCTCSGDSSSLHTFPCSVSLKKLPEASTHRRHSYKKGIRSIGCLTKKLGHPKVGGTRGCSNWRNNRRIRDLVRISLVLTIPGLGKNTLFSVKNLQKNIELDLWRPLCTSAGARGVLNRKYM